VTCAHCGSRLVIKRTPTSAYTEVLGRIEGHTAQMADNLDIIRLKSELELLDVAWANKRVEFEKAEATVPKATDDASATMPGCVGLVIAWGISGIGFYNLLAGSSQWTAGSDGGTSQKLIGGILLVAGLVGVILAVRALRKAGKPLQARKREEVARKAALRQALHEEQEAYEGRRAEILRRLDAHVGAGDRSASGEFVRAA
jgi:hypothetical protein